MNHLLKHINQDTKGDKAKVRTQQYIQLNIGAKEIHQVESGGTDNSQKYQAPTISSIDKYLSQNRHRACRLTHRRAVKEESKVVTRDWVDHQACSLLQYINVFANLLIMRSFFLFYIICAEKLSESTIFFNL